MGWCLGFIIEKVAIKLLRGVARIASLICTIGFSILFMEIASVIWGAETKSMPSFYDGVAFTIGEVEVVWYQLFMIASRRHPDRLANPDFQNQNRTGDSHRVVRL